MFIFFSLNTPRPRFNRLLQCTRTSYSTPQKETISRICRCVQCLNQSYSYVRSIDILRQEIQGTKLKKIRKKRLHDFRNTHARSIDSSLLSSVIREKKETTTRSARTKTHILR